MFKTKNMAYVKSSKQRKDGVIVAQRVAGEKHMKILRRLRQPFACVALLAWNTGALEHAYRAMFRIWLYSESKGEPLNNLRQEA